MMPVTFTSRRRPERKAVFTGLMRELSNCSPKILVGEIILVVVLSAWFERSEHWARHRLRANRDKTGSKILDALFNEITCLGFVGLFLFLVTSTGIADVGAYRILGLVHHHENPLKEVFEIVHMMIFMLLLVLLTQACAIYYMVRRINTKWEGYERMRAFGTSNLSLEQEMIKGGYVKRVENSEARSGQQLVALKPFVFAKSFLGRYVRAMPALQRLMRFRAIRHEFLFPREGAAPEIPRVPDAALFSFERYMYSRLGKTVVSCIDVDARTYLFTLSFVGLLIFPFFHMDPITGAMFQCAMSWGLAGCGGLLAMQLQHGLFYFMPKLPKDPLQILRLMNGTSMQMLRRKRLPGLETSEKARDSIRPDLGEVESQDQELLGPPEAFNPETKMRFVATSSHRSQTLFRLLVFFQAVHVTALIITTWGASAPSNTWKMVMLLAWAEWPLMLFKIMPCMMRRLTLRNSIELEKDKKAIRKVTMKSSASLFEDFRLMVQLIAFQKNAKQENEAWTVSEKEWTKAMAEDAYQRGLTAFDNLNKMEKEEIWAVFAAWDVNNDGRANQEEFVDCLVALGFSKESVHEVVRQLVRMVAVDSTEDLTWLKFRAIFGLAITTDCKEKMRKVLTKFYHRLDADGDGDLTLAELADGFREMHIAMDMDTVAQVLFLTFGKTRTSLTLDEFISWVEDYEAQ